jgi:hypothetical protein
LGIEIIIGEVTVPGVDVFLLVGGSGGDRELILVVLTMFDHICPSHDPLTLNWTKLVSEINTLTTDV